MLTTRSSSTSLALALCLSLFTPHCGSDDGGDDGGNTTGGRPPGETAAPLDPAQAARAAVMISSCLADDRARSYLRNFYMERGGDDAERWPGFIECLSRNPTGCAGVEACLGAKTDLTGPCEASCQGDLAIGCDDQVKTQVDCAKWGLTCRAGECVDGAAPAACVRDASPDRCDGQTPVFCNGELNRGPDCASLGMACEVTGEGASAHAHCRPAGAACQSESLTFGDVEYSSGLGCDDAGTLRACVNGGEATRACADVAGGFACQARAGQFFCGLAAECDPLEHEDACEGDALVVCNAGRLERISCPSLGFSRCEPKAGRCSPGYFDGAL